MPQRLLPPFRKDIFEKDGDIIIEIPVFRKHFDPTLSIAAKNSDGEYVSYCCLWYSDKTDYAYVEPVCTVLSYRGIGCFSSHCFYVIIKQLIEAVKDTPIYLPTFLASVYGFRRSEVLGLKWHNVDFENGTIWIRETLQQCTKEITGECNYTSETKTESSNRTLPMTPQVRDVLLKQKQLQQEHRSILERAYYLNDYVCTFDNGKEISPNYLSRTFHKIIVKTDLPSIRFHDLRHSVASNLLNDGFNAVQVAEWLGHSSSTTTLKFYAHIDKTSKMSIANSLAPV